MTVALPAANAFAVGAFVMPAIASGWGSFALLARVAGSVAPTKTIIGIGGNVAGCQVQ